MPIEKVPTKAIALSATLVHLWDDGIQEGVDTASEILDLCYLAPVDGPEGVYTFAPELRGLRKRLKGSNGKAVDETTIDPVNLYDASLTNDDFYRFFDVGLNDFQDDKIGRYNVLAHQFGVLAGSQPANEAEDVIAGADAATAICYDGLPFFSASHLIDPSKSASGTYSNRVAKSAGLTLDTFGEGLQAFEEVPSDDGKAANNFITHLCVPPKYRGIALDITENTHPAGLSGATNKWAKYGIKVLVIPNWKDKDQWMIADTRSSRRRPFVYQEREKARMRALYINPDGGWERTNRVLRWSIEARGACGYGYPRKAMLFPKS